MEKGLRPLVAGLQDPLVGCHDIGIQLEKNVSTGGLPSSARRTVCGGFAIPDKCCCIHIVVSVVA